MTNDYDRHSYCEAIYSAAWEPRYQLPAISHGGQQPAKPPHGREGGSLGPGQRRNSLEERGREGPCVRAPRDAEQGAYGHVENITIGGVSSKT
ncbi:hypothetical protein E2C01_055046 [Portunus trituberculatus]|uniref:Uncharacterized protein n=1 Tax=Portunus trituberculatus TaxID=210409 RepID=A0A5B7GWK1_PORTR|nr:hypothetical protein [Portunus trituberculatus]